MRVLLIRPPVPKHTIGLKHLMICEPLELEYVAAGIPEHEVSILDMILEGGLENRLKRFAPDIVATGCYINGVNEVKKICRQTKLWNSRCVTIVGGVHASVAPEDFADPAIDCIVLGDGTSIIAELVSAVQRGQPFEDIPGLAIPAGDSAVVRTALREYMPDPNSLPFPRRDLVGHLQHHYYYLFHQPVALMKTTWGCWYKCNFCVTWCVTGGRPYSRSPESIVDEIEQIPQHEVYIVDDIFLFDSERLSAIHGLLNRRGIKKNFLVYGRADFIAENEDTLRQWSEIGLKAVIVGLEATTDEELTTMLKRSTVDLNRRAIDVLRRNRIDIYASFIVQPSYRQKDWNRLEQFIQDSGIYFVNISPETPMPGSVIWQQYADQLSVPRKAHGLWDLAHPVLPTEVPLKDFYRSLIRAYARTVLDLRRANRLVLRTRPPVWSRRYLRLWLGALLVFLQLRGAHRHHQKRGLVEAEYAGPALQVDSERFHRTSSSDPKCFDTSGRTGRSLPAPVDPAGPLDPFNGFFSDPEQSGRSESFVYKIPAARRWFRIFSWGVPLGLYTYQQSLSGKSGPAVRVGNRHYINASSYDYLGLIGHPDIEAAAQAAIREYGTGTGGVRLLTGTNELHRRLEHELAVFKGVEECITYSSGYTANLAVISSLLGPGDRLIADAKIHRSVVDACRLANVPIRTFNHNDPDSLEQLLQKENNGRTLIAVEGLYSMDGDICPLREIVAIKERHAVLLMVDEAHALGVLGGSGRGTNEHFDIPADAVDIWMGTLSKAIPSNGGYIAGRRDLIYYLQHGSAPFMFSAALAPSATAAALESIRVILREPGRLERLQANAEFLLSGLKKMGYDTGASCSPIIPVILGGDESAYRTARLLHDRGILATAVVSPAVKAGTARLRLCSTAAMSRSCLDEILTAFEEIAPIEIPPSVERKMT